jgi:hypothetical protein
MDKEKIYNEKENEFNKIKNEFQDLLVSSNKEGNEKDDLIENLKNENNMLKEESEEKIMSLNEEIKSLKNQNQKLIDEAYNLKKIKGDLELAKISLENQLKSNQKQISVAPNDNFIYGEEVEYNDDDEEEEDEDYHKKNLKIKNMKKEIEKLKVFQSKYYNLEQENEKNKKTINELKTEINVLSLNQGNGVGNKSGEKKEMKVINEDERDEIDFLRDQNSELKKKLIENDAKVKGYEEKLLKMQQNLNEQLEEENKEHNKKRQKQLPEVNPMKSGIIMFDDENNGENNGEEVDMFSISNDIEKSNNTQQIFKNYKDLKNENESLKEVIQDLKQRIKELNSNYNNESDKNSHELSNEELTLFNKMINEKQSKIISLEDQLKEYQNKTNDIMAGKSDETKDKQIQILINEINSIRAKILNDISYNNRIQNFEEFIRAVEKINELNNEIIEPEIQDAFSKLNQLIEIYKKNDDNLFNKLMEELNNM